MIAVMALTRDPVALLLDRGARDLLARAYAAPRGQWTMTRLADPTPRHAAWAAAAYGIAVNGPDNASTLSGRHVNCHTRWGRAFMRALYWQHRWHGPAAGGRPGLRGVRRMVPNTAALQVEWGRRMPALGVIPAGRAVRIRVAYGGATARRVVRAKRDAERIYTDRGQPAGRFAVADGRDWR